MARKLAEVLAEQLHTVIFVAGFGLAYFGLWQWSAPAANVAAGLVLMLVAVAPFLRRQG